METSCSWDVKLQYTVLEQPKSTLIRSCSYGRPAVTLGFVTSAIEALVVNEIVSAGNNGKHFGCGKWVLRSRYGTYGVPDTATGQSRWSTSNGPWPSPAIPKYVEMSLGLYSTVPNNPVAAPAPLPSISQPSHWCCECGRRETGGR
jgi:hypothetical protein